MLPFKIGLLRKREKMKPQILIIFVLLSFLVTSSTAANSKSNQTDSENLSQDNSTELTRGPPCKSDDQCEKDLTHTAYCVLDHCVCPLGAMMVRAHGKFRCLTWFCKRDRDCHTSGLPATNERCIHGVCGCAQGWHADRFQCVKSGDQGGEE